MTKYSSPDDEIIAVRFSFQNCFVSLFPSGADWIMLPGVQYIGTGIQVKKQLGYHCPTNQYSKNQLFEN